jgi:protein phosphatase
VRPAKWAFLKMKTTDNKIHIPEVSLVLLVGASGSGKSTFARKHFKATEIISSDVCRALVSDNEDNQDATRDAFDLAYYIARKRMKNGLLTVIDATNVRKEDRQGWLDLAKEYHYLVTAIVFDMPEKLCIERNENRPERSIHKGAILRQITLLRKSRKWLKKDGMKSVFSFETPEEVEEVEGISRQLLYNNKKAENRPFDIIGDVHGCYNELEELLQKLGYGVEKAAAYTESNYGYNITAAHGRKVIFVGDLVDRGPDSPGVLRLVMSMVNKGIAFCVPGNHDVKLKRYLDGKNVQIKHGLEQTIEQLANESDEFKQQVGQFIDGLISHYVFDDGKLVVSHAGIKEEMQGRGSAAIRSFCLYGETTGEIDEFGLPVRYNWAAEYKGKTAVVYGHTPVPEAQWFNNTIDIDTGCVFGGKLTALRYPERQLVSVDAKQVYCEPVRPIDYKANNTNLQHEYDDVLSIEDIKGKLHIETRLNNIVTIREGESLAALEAMSRFAINPKWLIYLPPTMSPSETSSLEGVLEYPKEAFEYYKKAGVAKVVCEEKHMGSRAVVIICKNKEAVLTHFGIETDALGICYTRTGRNFFTDETLEKEFLTRINIALTQSGFWEDFATEWVCLDCELMPWSAKAQALINNQYASVGAAATYALTDAVNVLQKTTQRLPAISALLEKYTQRKQATEQFIDAYHNYCWPVNGLQGYKLAPFHIMATESNTYFDKDHEWHMEKIKTICAADTELLMATPYKVVELANENSVSDATKWWEDLTAKGGEGMVVKPFDFIVKEEKGLIQPAIKIRGKEYLRIIYGLEYTFEENITRLKNRELNSKRSLALREFALGVEGLERFVAKQPLRLVHQCVFGVLALESEAVDPRL